MTSLTFFSAWGVDDSMLDIDLPSTNAAPVASSVDTSNTNLVDSTPTTAPETTLVETPTEQPTATADVDPTPLSDEPKEPVAEQQDSAPESTQDATPASEADTPASNTTKERPAKGRKPDAGSAKKKAAKKPEVAKVQMNFDFDDE